MDDINIWKVSAGHAQRFQRGQRGVEKSLEDWIERDPSLVGEGLVMVGRRMQTAAGLIDLLGVDPTGRWVVIEIRKGDFRKETIAQAKNVAACILDMDEDELITRIDLYLKPRKIEIQTLLAEHNINDQVLFDKREIVIVVAGIGLDQPLEPLSKALSFQNHPIQVLGFDICRANHDVSFV